MSNPIVKRYCISLEGRLASPLLPGSGKDVLTDNDVMVDAYGRTYLPGSSIAGASLHYLSASCPDRLTELNQLFGSREGYRSRIYFYHADLFVLDNEGRKMPPVLSTRDGVKLDEFKTAADRAKYVLQMVNAGTSFRMRIEWILRENSIVFEEKEEELLCLLIDGIARGELTFGAKSRRGFGRLHLDNVLVRDFHHIPEQKQDSFDWLDWDWEKASFDRSIAWNPGQSILRNPESLSISALRTKPEWQELRIPLAVRQTLMIRHYNMPLSEEADYEQLTGWPEGQAVIPGTSWAGAIRRHLAAMIEEISMDSEFASFRINLLFRIADGWRERKPEPSKGFIAACRGIRNHWRLSAVYFANGN